MLVALALVTLALVASTLSSPVTVPGEIEVPAIDGPPQFAITSLGVNGSGCPPGSAYYLVNSNRTAVTVTFSQFQAQAGPSIAKVEARKNCQLTLNVKIPSGFSFTVLNVDYRGYYELSNKVKAIQNSIYYFQGEITQGESSTTLNGPVYGANYVQRSPFNLTPTIYSPCGQDTVLNINSAFRIDNSANTGGYGYIVNDSIDSSFKTTFNFQWLQC